MSHREAVDYGPQLYRNNMLDDDMLEVDAPATIQHSQKQYSEEEIREKKIALIDFHLEKLRLTKVDNPTKEQQDQIQYYADKFHEVKNFLVSLDQEFVQNVQNSNDMDELQQLKLSLIPKKSCQIA